MFGQRDEMHLMVKHRLEMCFWLCDIGADTTDQYFKQPRIHHNLSTLGCPHRSLPHNNDCPAAFSVFYGAQLVLTEAVD